MLIKQLLTPTNCLLVFLAAFSAFLAFLSAWISSFDLEGASCCSALLSSMIAMCELLHKQFK